MSGLPSREAIVKRVSDQLRNGCNCAGPGAEPGCPACDQAIFGAKATLATLTFAELAGEMERRGAFVHVTPDTGEGGVGLTIYAAPNAPLIASAKRALAGYTPPDDPPPETVTGNMLRDPLWHLK